MTAAVIAAQNASISASSSGSGLEDEVNPQLAALLSHTILSIQIGASRVAAKQNHLQTVITYQSGATTISTPFVLKLFSGKSLSAVGAEIDAFMASNPTYFFSPVSFHISDDRRAAAPVVLGLLYNTSYADGQSHFGTGGSGGGGGYVGFNVKDYGAVGNGIADDYAAIMATQAAAGDRGAIFFPPGTYGVSQSLIYRCSFSASNRGLAIIQPLAGFVGTHLMLSDGSLNYLEFENLVFSANFMSVHLFGSPGGASHLTNKGNLLEFNLCKFIGCADGYYPLYSKAIFGDEEGGLTGSVLTLCEFIGNHNWMNFGNSEDDIYFQSCRFYHTYNNATDWLFQAYGNNTKYVSCYFSFGPQDFVYAGLKIYMFLGSYNCSFDQCHWEYGASDISHIIIGGNPTTQVAFREMRLNLVSCTTLISLLLCALSTDSNGFAKSFIVEGIEKYDANPYKLLWVYCDVTMSDTNNTFVALTLSGCDQITPANLWGSAGANSRRFYDPVKIHGQHRGCHYAPREPGAYFSSGVTPRAASIQLKRPGWQFLAINAYLTPHLDTDVMSGLYFVYWDGTTVGQIGQIGATTYNGAKTPATLTVGAPNGSGILALSVAWGGGASCEVCIDVSVSVINQIYNA